MLFWHKVFVHWKLKLPNFLMDSVLIILLQVQYRSVAIVFKLKNNPQGWVWIMEFLLMENVYMLSFC